MKFYGCVVRNQRVVVQLYITIKAPESCLFLFALSTLMGLFAILATKIKTSVACSIKSMHAIMFGAVYESCLATAIRLPKFRQNQIVATYMERKNIFEVVLVCAASIFYYTNIFPISPFFAL